MTLFGKLDNEVKGSHTQAEWAELVQVYGWRCFYCGKSVAVGSANPNDELTKDHFYPVCRGGLDFIWNIVPACFACNRLKGQLTGEEFQKARPGLVKNGPQQSTGIARYYPEDLAQGVETSDFARSASVYLGSVKSMDRPHTYWKRRREVLAQQINALHRTRLESAGQLRFQFQPSPKPVSEAKTEPKDKLA